MDKKSPNVDLVHLGDKKKTANDLTLGNCRAKTKPKAKPNPSYHWILMLLLSSMKNYWLLWGLDESDKYVRFVFLISLYSFL